ncbi:uncharacterized protein LOC62_02G003486 [Vanrija pseudolonga]|uniref:Peptidoglycan binding-like domain-containing protein n=1 Tax=Vanrija pseudolonga TaxID=143232 RepID=A0AAF0Y4G7_9TREE|nr:hypothetical protein LOC62_02G003486 [Vanrija pseudolonga]
MRLSNILTALLTTAFALPHDGKQARDVATGDQLDARDGPAAVDARDEVTHLAERNPAPLYMLGLGGQVHTSAPRSPWTAVAALQNIINERNGPSNQLLVDGDYGPKTAAEVERYQRAWTPSFVKPYFAQDELLGKLLQVGYSGSPTRYITALQLLLQMWYYDDVEVNGKWSSSYASLVDFQRKGGIPAQYRGRVGRCTWSLLFGGVE